MQRAAGFSSVPYGATRPAAPVALDFVDHGAGTLASVVAPAQTGLAGFGGTIRTRVEYSVNGAPGAVTFDVVYSPGLPAVWSGPVRAVQEPGALARGVAGR